MNSRKLALKREVLSEISADDLRGIIGGSPDPQTRYSCLDYISCWAWQCLRTLRDCIE